MARLQLQWRLQRCEMSSVTSELQPGGRKVMVLILSCLYAPLIIAIIALCFIAFCIVWT